MRSLEVMLMSPSRKSLPSDPRRGVLVVGGGGHAKVVMDILLAAGVPIAGFTDPGRDLGEQIGEVPCLGDDSAWPTLRAGETIHAIVALGDNVKRRQAGIELRRLGFLLINAVHPTAVVSASARLGSGVALMPGAIVNAFATIGDDSIVNTSASVDHDCRIGSGVHIAPGCHLAGSVEVGDLALLGVGSTIGRGRPLRIGASAIVGVGSVVIHDVPPATTVVGHPARILLAPSPLDERKR
jgi:UDP-perosamine 4-acetyltransferase